MEADAEQRAVAVTTAADDRARADRVRVLATCAVVAIHAAGGFEGRLIASQRWLSDAGLAGLVSQLARFSVPLFVVLSGYGLGKSRRASLVSFYTRRATRVVLPYLAWSFLSLAYRGLLSEPAVIAEALLKGTADYHLYFCSFIIQAYLLWPLLRRVPWAGVSVLFGVQLALSSPVHFFWPGRISLPGWLLVHWAGWFCLGVRLADRPAGTPRPRLSAVLLGLSGALVVAEYFWFATWQADASWFNHFFRFTVIGYGLAWVLRWRRGPALAPRPPDGWAVRLARVSFTVYLLHPWLLRGIAPTRWGDSFALLYPVALAGSFGAGLFLDRWVRGKLARALLGLG